MVTLLCQDSFALHAELSDEDKYYCVFVCVCACVRFVYAPLGMSAGS